MSVIDKFLDVMKLGGDDDYDDYDDYDEFDDDYEEEKPEKRSSFRRKKEEDYDDFDDEEPRERSKVTPIRQAPRKQGKGMEVCVIKPTSFDDSREITETLLSNRTVVLNFEGVDMDVAQRIIDFTSGSCFAI